jgi:hypothetical protein
MTIREYLRRRVWKLVAWCITAGFVPLLLSALYPPTDDRLREICYILFWGSIGVAVLLIRTTPCPRCSVPLGATGGRLFTRRLVIDACPYCGVSFDAHIRHPLRRDTQRAQS